MRVTLPKLSVIAFVFFAISAQAQLKFPVTNNDLRTNLSKILTDYANGFSSLKGDTIEVNPQAIEFSTKLEFSGAEHNSIVQYKSNTKNPVYSWQAVLMTTEDFDEASKKYKWLFNQLKVMTVKVEDYSFTLSGDYAAPEESKKFSSSMFKLTPNAANMPKLKIEASMQFEFPEWKIGLMVYEREREDNERGEVNGD